MHGIPTCTCSPILDQFLRSSWLPKSSLSTLVLLWLKPNAFMSTRPRPQRFGALNAARVSELTITGQRSLRCTALCSTSTMISSWRLNIRPPRLLCSVSLQSIACQPACGSTAFTGFLELLRYRLPDSLDYMISFIYFAHQMMSLLYETVRAFKDTWIECLGDLGRYRMAIEEEDAGVRETWAGVARFWYSKAASRSPAVGRLSHHLAILARPHALRQLYLFCRSLTCIQPFLSARESIVTLFDPVTGSVNLEASNSSTSRIDSLFIRLHSMLFTKDKLDEFDGVLRTFLGLLDSQITTAREKWHEEGSHIAVSAIAALFDYGSPDSILRKLMEHGNFRIRQQAKTLERAECANASPSASLDSEPSLEGLKAPDSLSRTQFLCAVDMFSRITKLVFCQTGDNKTTVDRNVLPFANLALNFYHSLADIHSLNLPFDGIYVIPLLDGIPREEISTFGNNLFKADDLDPKYEKPTFIRPEQGDVGLIVEDHMVRGQTWAQRFFPVEWFETEDEVDEELTLIERASTMSKRATRVAWLLRRQAEVGANTPYIETHD